ncbi:MAG: hypothetical protein ACKVXR_12300 [Planctomycetota bacterium]
MHLARKTWILGASIALGVGCLLGVATLGRGAPPSGAETGAPGSVGPGSVAEPSEVPSNEVETSREAAPRAAGRAAIPGAAGDAPELPARKSSREPRTESEFHASFLELADRDPDSFERAARAALREEGPACRKVAALRALCDTRSPRADDALLAAVLELPDVPTGQADSVPGFALRCLSARAASEAGSRRVLEELGLGLSLPPERLRAAARNALLETADETELPRIVERLRAGTVGPVPGDARAALARNPHTIAAEAALASLGPEEPAVADFAGEEE